jgi:lactate dehydrogenase-like 2-hydroxyacid dehydrogenase
MPPTLCEASPGTLKAYLARSFTTLVEAKISERYQVLRNPSGRGSVYHSTPESLLGVSDIFLITAPGTPDLAGFLNRRRIELLPSNAVVVNIARGEMIDDDALIEALITKKVFAAGLDVFDHEPEIDPRYRTLENVFLTPHIGSATEDTRNAMGLILLEGLHAFETGQVARNRVC